MIMSIMAGSERTVLGVSGDEEGNFNNGHLQNGDQQIPFYPFANGQELNVGINIINQYEQLVGEYNRLDDELWFSKPEDDDEAMDGSNQGLDCNFVSTYEHTLDLEKPSRSVDNAVCDGGTVTGKERSSSLRDSSLDQSQTSSPVSVLQRRSYSNALTRAIKHARDKFHCPVKGDSHKDLCSLGTAFVVTERSESFQCESYVESHLLDVMEEEIPSKHLRMKKISDLLQAGSGESNQNPDPKPIPKEAVKKCLHCESTKTPQWRDGPNGKGTLCNACGVQYKKGSLLPEYRPLRSPTFDPTLHTNLVRSGSRESGCNHDPKPIPKQKRTIKAVKKCLHCESTKTPKCRRGPTKQTTPCDAYGVQYKKARFSSKDRSLRSSTSDSSLHSNVLQSGSKENDQDPDPKQILMQKRPLKAVKKCLHCGSTKTPQWMDGPLGKATLCNACGVQYKKATLPSTDHSLESSVCDSSLHFNMLQSISGQNDENPDPKSIPEEKHPLKAVKKCLHCESTKTPQWRDGPLGKRTLCNACGVQYRHGRLFPEYRPLKSPTFDPSLHSSLHKKVQQMRMSMSAAKGASSEKGRQPT